MASNVNDKPTTQPELNSNLNRYYADEVQLSKKDTSKILDSVMADTEEIVKYINQLDNRFGAEAQRGGSYYQRLKVGEADEFDLTIPLLGIGPRQWYQLTNSTFSSDYKTIMDCNGYDVPAHPGKGYVSLMLTDTREHERYKDLMVGLYLCPSKVKDRLRKLLKDTLDALEKKRVIAGLLNFSPLNKISVMKHLQ